MNEDFDYIDDFLNFDYTDFEKAMVQNKELAEKIAVEKIQKEMLLYVVSLVNQEYNGNSPDDAYKKWEHYKRKKGIDIDAI